MVAVVDDCIGRPPANLQLSHRRTAEGHRVRHSDRCDKPSFGETRLKTFTSCRPRFAPAVFSFGRPYDHRMEIGYRQGTIGAMQRNKARQEPGTRKERKRQRDVGKLNVAVATMTP